MQILVTASFFALIVTITIPHQCYGTDAKVTVKLGTIAELVCPKPMGRDLVWDMEKSTWVSAIAVGGEVQGNKDKYSLVTSPVEGVVREILVIRNASPDDAGIYRCYSFFNSDYYKIELDVLVPPVLHLIEPPITLGNEGQNMRVVCIVSASRPAADVTWFIEGRKETYSGLNRDQAHANGTLTRTSEFNIILSRDLYLSILVCSASISQLEYFSNQEEVIDMNLKPMTPFISGTEDPFFENIKRVITCHANGAKPAAAIQWFWGQNLIYENHRDQILHQNGTIDARSDLEIVAKAEDNGTRLACMATNAAIPPGEALLSVDTDMVVYFKPRVTANVTTSSTFEGNPLMLQCFVMANPAPMHAQWLHNELPVRLGSRMKMADTTGHPALTITSTHREDSGEYRCSVTNIMGTTVSEVTRVVILYSPRCVKEQTFKFGAPVGGHVNITCWVSLYPTAAVYFGWTVHDREDLRKGHFDPGNPGLAFNTYTYVVRTSADYGTVSCRASNGVGEMEEACAYIILPPGAAEAPSACKVTDTSYNSVWLVCVEQFDGGSTPTYTLHAESAHGTISQSSTGEPRFHLTGLHPGTHYFLRVCASNRDHPNDVACVQQFSVTTKLNSGAPGPAMPLDEEQQTNRWTYIVTGSFLAAMLLVLLVALLMCVFIKRNKAKKEPSNRPLSDIRREAQPEMTENQTCFDPGEKRDPEGASITDIDAVAREYTVPNTRNAPGGITHKRSSKANPSFMEQEEDFDPTYDRADGLVYTIATPSGVSEVSEEDDIRPAFPKHGPYRYDIEESDPSVMYSKVVPASKRNKERYSRGGKLEVAL